MLKSSHASTGGQKSYSESTRMSQARAANGPQCVPWILKLSPTDAVTRQRQPSLRREGITAACLRFVRFRASLLRRFSSACWEVVAEVTCCGTHFLYTGDGYTWSLTCASSKPVRLRFAVRKVPPSSSTAI